MKSLTNFDLAQNSLLNGVLHPASGAPSSPKPGQVYYSTSTSILMVWNGTAWRPTDAAGLTDGSIQNSALATNPLARANHTGTQAAATISNLQVTVQGYALSSFAVPVNNIPMNGYTFTGLPTPTAAGMAAEYAWVIAQVQAAAAGIASKTPVQAITTSNVTLSGLGAIDGYTPAAGDRILVTGQTTASQNGVYNAASGAWTRTVVDGPAPGELEPGAMWLVVNGSTYAGSQWRCSNASTITVGSTAVTIVQFGAASLYSAGNGLLLTGTSFSVKPLAGGGIISDATGIYVDTSVVARKFSGTITGDGATTSFTVTHNLGTTDVITGLKDSSGAKILADVTTASATTVTVTFGAAPANGTTYRATVIG